MPHESNSGHHSGLDAGTVAAALWRAVEMWEQAACDCCTPTPADEAVEDLSAYQADRLRRFGIDMAQVGQWAIDRAAEGE